MSSLFQRLQKTATQSPDHTAITEGQTRWTYSALVQNINRLADGLRNQGINPGDRVALVYLNQKEFFVSFYALLRIGAVIVPINYLMPPDDIRYVILNAGVRLVLTTDSLAPHFEGKPIAVLVSNQEDPKDPKFPAMEELMGMSDPNADLPTVHTGDSLAVLMYTSGTSGNPKGVMLTENNFMTNLDGISKAFHFPEGESFLIALPLFHAFGLIIGLYAMDIAATVALVPRFHPTTIVETIAKEKISILPLVPTMFSVILSISKKTGVEPFQSLKYAISGGAGLPTSLLKEIEEALGFTILEGYGLTETSPVIAVNRPEVGSIPASVGKPLENVQVKLVDDQDQDVPIQPGEESGVGEILVKGGNVTQGYYQLQAENDLAFTSDGWFKTGDLGNFDADGNLKISAGRKKDLIIKAGENISPLKVEEILYRHPSVQEASVIGVPDEKLGEGILACVQLNPDAGEVSISDLKKFCREHIPPFMVPDNFKFYDELPKNPTGKILKKVLRQENASPEAQLSS